MMRVGSMQAGYATLQHIGNEYVVPRPQTDNNMQQSGDIVDIHMPPLPADEEARQAMLGFTQGIQESPQKALSLHQGLDYDRVMALLSFD